MACFPFFLTLWSFLPSSFHFNLFCLIPACWNSSKLFLIFTTLSCSTLSLGISYPCLWFQLLSLGQWFWNFFFLALNSLRYSIPLSNWPQHLHLDISKAPKLYILDLNPWPSFQTFPSCSVSLYSKVAWITLKIYIQNLWWDRFELSLRSNSLKEKFINGNSFNKIASELLLQVILGSWIKRNFICS